MQAAQRSLRVTAAVVASVLMPEHAGAATALDGATMSWPWALPFTGLLLTIAAGPLAFPHVWHRHYAKIATAWSLLALACLAGFRGPAVTAQALVHVLAAEYLSFIVVLFALYTVAGGIHVIGRLGGTPVRNAMVLAVGTVMASVVGTTGAAMILIRPLIRANRERRRNVHVIVFFIFLVANIGGALTPLGDPPLFVGFLRGVDFFWPLRHLLFETALVASLVLATFFALDCWLHRAEPPRPPTPDSPLRVRGLINVALIVAILGMILLSATWKPGRAIDVYGTQIELQNLIRDGGLVVIALLSVWLTPEEHREANGFSWEPIREVAKLFAAIFVCIIPVLAMLQAGRNGSFGWLLNAVSEPDGSPHEIHYFWLTGSLSAVLDNAPTYLVFFEIAGGDPARLMGPLAPTLAAISMGAVYMGAMTYIGNAPNLMVRAIAEERGIKMPGFLGYIGWAAVFLLPVFVLLTLVFIR
jgi:Na+/H+ antiporter NhaD/arsenite permease-like protein